MEADSPPPQPPLIEVESTNNKSTLGDHLTTTNDSKILLCDEVSPNNTIHAFNLSNITVIENEKLIKNNDLIIIDDKKNHDGSSDSGVEVLEINDNNNLLFQRTLSSNSANSNQEDQDFEQLTNLRSCDSSIISYCSNYDDAYNLLVRRNSTLLVDYNHHQNHDDHTSENGSESSSITYNSSISSNKSKQLLLNNVNSTKKQRQITNNLIKNNKLTTTPSNSTTSRTTIRDRSRSKQLATNSAGVKNITVKSVDRLQNTRLQQNQQKITVRKHQTPTTIPTTTTPNNQKKDNKKLCSSSTSTSTRNSSCTRTPVSTPTTDDGRWPSIHSKPAPLMSRSLRGFLETPVKSNTCNQKAMNQLNDNKTIEKYATLPRRRIKDNTKTIDDKKKLSSTSTTNSTRVIDDNHRRNLLKDMITLSTRTGLNNNVKKDKKKKQNIKIYHETMIQTALTMTDINRALAGLIVKPNQPNDVEKFDKDCQADIKLDVIEQLELKLKQLNDKYDQLDNQYKLQSLQLIETENKLKDEQIEKNCLKEELKSNTNRVLALIEDENCSNSNNEENDTSSDSLLVLENRFQNVSKLIIDQENEISKLNLYCRQLELNLNKSLFTNKNLLQQYDELKIESNELQEFMQAEKTTLSDSLKDAENELIKNNLIYDNKVRELEDKQNECNRYIKLNEQKWQENLALQAKLGALEAKSRELLVHQGGSMSGTAVALSALIGRLDGLINELVTSYNISEQVLEDVIFHNEAYSNSSSSPDATPDKTLKYVSDNNSDNDKTLSPLKKGSSFVSAVINAIKNATIIQTPNKIHSQHSEQSSPNEMLDSETEPCLMMEPVLEDVIIPDGHSHNMISSSHSLLNSHLSSSTNDNLDLSQQTIFHHSLNNSLNTSYSSDNTTFSSLNYTSNQSFSLVDQVIDVDNLVTKLLKVIRIIQIENDDNMNELQEQRDQLSEQIDKQQETNKVVVTQLKDWELLGARLKGEVKELMQQLSRKNNELDNIKSELNNRREEVEKLNQDVCELSTALSKAELEMKMKDDEAMEAVKNWEKNGELPELKTISKLILSQNEYETIKQQLKDKERHLSELTQEFVTSRQILTESLKEAVNEAKKQYDAIDNALEVLHNNQNVVQQCKPLMELQRDLENISFQSASAMPLVAPADCNANAAMLKAIANLQIASPINTTA